MTCGKVIENTSQKQRLDLCRQCAKCCITKIRIIVVLILKMLYNKIDYNCGILLPSAVYIPVFIH